MTYDDYETVTDYRTDRYRAVVGYDDFPEEPELFTAFVRVGSYSVSAEGLCSQYSEKSEIATEDALVAAIEHFGTDPSDRDWFKVEKYMRAYWGVSELHTFYSSGIRGWYVGTDKGTANEYEQWCEGEVFIIQIQELQEIYTDRRVHSPSSGFSAESYQEETWEDIETVGGFIGSDYAVEEAKSLLSDHVESLIEKGNLS